MLQFPETLIWVMGDNHSLIRITYIVRYVPNTLQKYLQSNVELPDTFSTIPFKHELNVLRITLNICPLFFWVHNVAESIAPFGSGPIPPHGSRDIPQTNMYR